MITSVHQHLGGTFVGWARDIDVSALKTTPWEREELAYWLERPSEWDVMIWQRMDRAVRSMADMADLGRYAKQHGKRLVFASGPGGGRLELDFSSPMSELIMLILAFAAQLEGQTIMERTQGAAAHLQSLGRWPGGPVPYGFQPVRKLFSDGNEGWWLDEHPHTAGITREMVGRAISGMSYKGLVDWLNAEKKVTPKNHRARLATPPRPDDKSSRWMTTVVRTMLRSPLLRGHLVKKDGTVVRSADGSPVLQGAPLINDATWYALQDALKDRTIPSLTAPRRTNAHALLGVLVCDTCGHNLHAAQRKDRRGDVQAIFRCNSTLHAPGQPYPSVPRDGVLEYVDLEFRRRLGFFRRTQIVRTPGVDNRQEIAELTADVAELTTRWQRLRGPLADEVEAQAQGLADRLEELQKVPYEPPREQTVYLDRTWGEDWEVADQDTRREMLLSAGVKVRVLPPKLWRRPLHERLAFDIERVDPEADALEDAAYQASL